MEVTLTSANFEQEVYNSAVPVVVDFWATWCGPCMMLGPVLEEIDKEQAGKVKICKVNVDEQPALAEKFGVEVIPTVFLVNKGEEPKLAFRGYMGKEQVEAALGL